MFTDELGQPLGAGDYLLAAEGGRLRLIKIVRMYHEKGMQYLKMDYVQIRMYGQASNHNESVDGYFYSGIKVSKEQAKEWLKKRKIKPPLDFLF